MIGNDVIDLALARTESNWKRKGFLNKLFTGAEQQLILTNPDPESILWNLWSRKEAAYKIYSRETQVRAFMPLQLECVFENACDGKVSVNGKEYFTQTCIFEEQIHTIAVTLKDDFENVVLLDEVSDVSKRDGIPYHKKSGKPISISHHGRFGAIVTLA
jgi:phosphopantetheinyl transferase (holo-ACP synthase)